MGGNDQMVKAEILAQEIGRRFNRSKIIVHFREHGLDYGFLTDGDGHGGYRPNELSGLTNDEIIDLAEEYDIDITNVDIHKAKTTPVKLEHDSSPAKAFISHLAIAKIGAINLSGALQEYNIQGFVAHEHIKPSKQWQDEIEKALNKMDFFISLHTKGFSQSMWCQQEVGFAVARGVEIISIRFDEDPTGFIGKYQALTATNNIVKDVTNIFNILKNSSKTKDLYSAKIADIVVQKPIEQLAGKYKMESKRIGKKEINAYTNFLQNLQNP